MSSDEFVVTPWNVEGDIDYEKLIKQFGTQKISPEILSKMKQITGEDYFMLRRGIFFSHRDLNLILDNFEKGKKFFLYTGRGPSGNTHIGHLVPWVFAKWLQEKFDVNIYFQLTDDEKFYTKSDLTLEDTNNFALENALDFIALGFNPEKTKIIINTQNIKKLYPIAAQVAKKINFSNTKAVFGFTNDTNVGMIFYTSLQSAPCFIEDLPVLIPLGVDQDPHFRITRDVAPKINKPKPALIHNIMIPSLTGPGGKMSASDQKSTIYTTDSPEEVKKKINKYGFSGGQVDIDINRKEKRLKRAYQNFCYQMNRVEIVAEDKYEAQKLASLIFVKEGNETFITEIIDVFGTEIVISIKDKSAHSVVLKDKEQVVKFTDFMQSVIEKKSKIVGTSTDEEQVGIVKEDLN